MQVWLFLLIIAVTMMLLLSEALPTEEIGLLVLLSLGVTGLVSWREAFAGFSSKAVMAMFGLFIISGALKQSGVANWVGNKLVAVARGNESALIGIIMTSAAALSAIMVNIGTAAVLLPAVMSASRKTRIHPTRLLMPLGFGTIVGGMLTLIGATPTIIMNEFLDKSSLLQFPIFGQTGRLLPAAVLSILVMVLAKDILLPSSEAEYESILEKKESLIRLYRLDKVLYEVIVQNGARIAGKNLAACDLRKVHGVYVLGISRTGTILPPPEAGTVLREGDRLLVRAPKEALEQASAACGLTILPEPRSFPPDLLREGFQIAEVTLAPRSWLNGKRVAEADFFRRYGLRIFAIDHRGKPIHVHLADHKLEFGDALLIHGPADRMAALKEDENFIVLETTSAEQREQLSSAKAWITVGITFLSLAAVALHLLPLDAASVGGGTLLLLSGVLTVEEAYRSISWKVLIFISGMLPLGAAMLHSGTANLVGNALGTLLQGHSLLWFFLFIAVVASAIGHLTSNVTAAVVTVPLAIQTAVSLGADPGTAALVAAIGASNVFSSPTYQVNVFLMGPGEYRPADFVKKGAIFTLIVILVTAVGAYCCF